MKPASLYWPNPCPGAEEKGLIVGWATGCDEIFVVAGVIPEGDAQSAITNVRRLCEASGFRSLHKECGTVPCILGYWDPNGSVTGSGHRFDDDAAADLCAVQPNSVCTHPLLHIVAAPPSAVAAAAAERLDAACVPTNAPQRVDRPQLSAVTLGRPGRPASHSGERSQTPSSPASASACTDCVAPLVVSSHYPDFLCPEVARCGRISSFSAGDPTRGWYVMVYRPPDPLRLELLATRPCRVPAMHALGTTALVRTSAEPAVPMTGFECTLHQLNAASFVYRYATGEIRIPQSTIGSPVAASAAGGSGGVGVGGLGSAGLPSTLSLGAGGSAAAATSGGATAEASRSLSGRRCSASPAPGAAAGSTGAGGKLPGAGAAPERSTAVTSYLEDSIAVSRARATVTGHALRLLSLPLLAILLLLRWAGGVALWVLLRRIPHRVPVIGGLCLYDKSALARQLHLRVCEFCSWPTTLVILRRMRWEVATGRHWHPADALYSQTAQWHDSLWRSVFDFLVGIGVCLLLSRVPWLVALVLRLIHTFGQILHIDVLRTWIDWLMGLPAGLKLNHFAGRKIGGAVLSFIHFWEYITTFLTPWEPAIVVCVGLVGLGGCSLLLAVTSDVLELATIHLYTLYAQFAWLHNQQVRLMGSLWKLFRGKKKNVLRGRVDSNDFDMAQLLLGTLLSTVVFFLFPTTLVYYAFFLMIYLGIQSMRAILWWLTTILNNIPLYTCYCLLFSPHRLPAGIYLSLKGTRTQPGGARVRTLSTLQRLRSTPPGALELYDSDLEEDDEGEAGNAIGDREGAASAGSAAGATGRERYHGAAASGGVDAATGAAASAGGAASATMDGVPATAFSAPTAPGAGSRHGSTLLFWVHPASANAGIVLAPFLEALSVILKRFSVGLMLRVILFGEPGLALIGTIDEAPGPGARSASSAAVASTGLAFGIVNAAANAPVEAPAAGAAGGAASAQRRVERTYRMSAKEGPGPTQASWRVYWQELCFLADVLCYGLDYSPPAAGVLPALGPDSRK